MLHYVRGDGGQIMVPAEEIRLALKMLVIDCLATDFNEHWESFKQAERLSAELEALGK
jgi:hypothetical protein